MHLSNIDFVSLLDIIDLVYNLADFGGLPSGPQVAVECRVPRVGRLVSVGSCVYYLLVGLKACPYCKRPTRAAILAPIPTVLMALRSLCVASYRRVNARVYDVVVQCNLHRFCVIKLSTKIHPSICIIC